MAEKSKELAYHRKYRPATINDYMGDRVRAILLNRFRDEKDFPSTVLLSGSRGCGKTSAARLIAKEYHCENRVDGHACGVCETCKEMEDSLINSEAGEEVEGVIEIDAAKTTGKDALTDIIEDAIVPPLYRKYKVLILDECHMISPAGQNSLLKVVEEPPAHLVFIFCTTNPEKVLDTIKSRCQLQIVVEKPSLEDLVSRLLWISERERLEVSREALRIIAKKANRIPREALNRLESMAKNYGKRITVESIQNASRDVASEIYLNYFLVANSNQADIMAYCDKIKDKDFDYKVFITGLIRFALDCVYIKHGINMDDYPIEQLKAIKNMFDLYTSEEMDLLLQIVEKAANEISPDETVNELSMVLTAMRMGKIKSMARGVLEKTHEVAEEQTRVGFVKYQQLLREEREAALARSEAVNFDTSIMASVFGRNLSIVSFSDSTAAKKVDKQIQEEIAEEQNKERQDNIERYGEDYYESAEEDTENEGEDMEDEEDRINEEREAENRYINELMLKFTGGIG
jgi:DNA polymerase-3 subunit gamma/tau